MRCCFLIAFLAIISKSSQKAENKFKVSLINTSTKEKFIFYEDDYKKDVMFKKNAHRCSSEINNEYMIVFNSIYKNQKVTFYKICCLENQRNKEFFSERCMSIHLYRLEYRMGKKWAKFPQMHGNHEIYGKFMSTAFTIIIFLIFLYPICYVLFIRKKEINNWSKPPDQFDQSLMLLVEKPPMTEIRFGDKSCCQMKGQHSFLDVCRVTVARDIFEDRQLQKKIVISDTSSHRNRKDARFFKYNDEEEFLYYLNLDSVGMMHVACPVNRTFPLTTNNVMFDLLYSHGPYIFPWSVRQLLETFNQARDHFSRDDTCLYLESPIVIIADIRGRYIDLHRWIEAVGLPYRKKILFLGCVVDPDESIFENYSIECLSFVAAMKIAYPQHVFMLRGAAETVFSFPNRFGNEADLAVLTAARQMCNYLPVAAFIDNEILAVPSGFNHEVIYDPNCFNNISRPLKCDNLPLVVKFLLFGQPTSTTQIFDHDKKVGFFKYGLQAVEDLCTSLKVKQVIRGRNKLTKNPLFLCERKFVSLYSIPTEDVPGCIIYRDKSIGTIFLKLWYQTSEFRSK